MTVRRVLNAGPQSPTSRIRANQADLLDALPGVRLPDLHELRDRGVLGRRTTATPTTRRSLGNGGLADQEQA